MKGELYLIPNTLGEVALFEVLPITVKKKIEEIDIYIVESEKSARRFIKAICPNKSQERIKLFTLNKFTESMEIPNFLIPCTEQKKSIGLISDAGCPAIADPGSEVVRLAHERNIKVIPIVGPSSILMAMMASGMNGQNFAFNGYLPIEKNKRKSKLKQLEKRSFDLKQAQAFIETPYRNQKLLEDLCSVLHSDTRICIACDLTLSSEHIKTLSAVEWQKNKVNLHKRPTIFILQKD